MNVLDVTALAALTVGAFAGYRSGLLARVSGWIGAVVGLVVGIRLAEPALRTVAPETPQGRLLLTLSVVLGLAVVGQAIGVLVGASARARLHPESIARRTDHWLGAVAGVVGVLVTLWLLAPVLGRVPGTVARQARTSLVLGVVERVSPDGVNPLRELQNLIALTPFPEVFDDLLASPEVGPPPETLAVPPAVVEGVAQSTVNVEVVGCNRIQEGSGFVVEPGLVATNAHVVAGGDTFEVLRSDGIRLGAQLVGFDPARDLALLAVPDIDRPPLPVADVPLGTEVAVFGHPGGQDQLRVATGRVSDRIDATGRDIYGIDRVTRDVLVLASDLRQGDSGSAVVNADGQVAGVTFAVAADRDGVAYALAPPELRAVLAQRAGGPVDSGACLR